MSRVQVTVKTRTSKTTADRFAKLAARNGRSVSSELRIAIDRHLTNGDAYPKGERP